MPRSPTEIRFVRRARRRRSAGKAQRARERPRPRRAEEILRELEELGLSVPKRLSALVAALRHPLLIGVLLAVVSGVIASLLIPSLTRSWQDRPKELALKRDLVARISREATTAIDKTGFEIRVGRPERDPGGQVNLAVIRRWRIESSIIGSELTTYFKGSAVLREWREYACAVTWFLRYFLRADRGFNKVYVHFSEMRFRDPEMEYRRKLVTPNDDSGLAFLLLAERDQIASNLLESGAAGFSHGFGFWIFRG